MKVINRSSIAHLLHLIIIVLTILIAAASCQRASAQVVPVVMNAPVPDVELGKFLELPDKQMKFSELKGKVIILDFFNIWCSSCIAAMPQIDSLQAKFGDKIRILLVTKNKEGDVKKLFDRIKLKIPNLFVIVQDTIFNKLFPHYGEPHHVWIDQQGYYRKETFPYNATNDNIVAMLQGQQIRGSDKRDGIYKDDTSLLTQATRFNNLIKSYSVLMKGLYEYSSSSEVSFGTDSITHQLNSFRAINATAVTLLQYAYGKEAYGYDYAIYNGGNNKRMLVEVNDKTALAQPANASGIDDWKQKYLWSYEVKVDSNRKDNLHAKMRSDLSEALPYTAIVEKRKAKYYAIVLTNKGRLKSAIPENNEPAWVRIETGRYKMENVPLIELVERVNYAEQIPYPVLDETGIVSGVNLDIAVSALTDTRKLNTDLKKYGLELKEKEGQVAFLVIRDR